MPTSEFNDPKTTQPPTVRRWDQPPVEPNNPADLPTLVLPEVHPYSERTQPDPGVRQYNHLKAVPDRMVTVDGGAPRKPRRLRRDKPRTTQAVDRPIQRWAVPLTVVCHTTIVYATWTGEAHPPTALLVLLASLACCICLITAEHLTIKDRKKRTDPDTTPPATFPSEAGSRASGEGKPSRDSGEDSNPRPLGNTELTLPFDSGEEVEY